MNTDPIITKKLEEFDAKFPMHDDLWLSAHAEWLPGQVRWFLGEAMQEALRETAREIVESVPGSTRRKTSERCHVPDKSGEHTSKCTFDSELTQFRHRLE